jgi:hypothetical protein
MPAVANGAAAAAAPAITADFLRKDRLFMDQYYFNWLMIFSRSRLAG